MSESTVVTVRVEAELLAWVDSRGKRSAVVTEALETLRNPPRVAITDATLEIIRATVREVNGGTLGGKIPEPERYSGVAGSTPAVPSKPSMADLRDICAGKLPVAPAEIEPEEDDVTPKCCVCENQMRGVADRLGFKWACSDPSCGMYGQHQKVRR